MAEPQPGRGQGRPSSGGRGTGGVSAPGVTAAFKVDNTSLAKLNDLWKELVDNVRKFNAELGKIDGKKLDQLAASMRGGTGGGRKSSTIDAGTMSPAAKTKKAGYPGLHPSYGASDYDGEEGLPSAAGGGRGSWMRRHPYMATAAGAGSAIALYGRAHEDNMVNFERMAQMSAWGMAGQGKALNEKIRHEWAAVQGPTDMNDRAQMMGILQASGGLAKGPQGGMLQGASQMSMLLGTGTAGATGEAQLSSVEMFANMRNVGIRTMTGGETINPGEFARQYLTRTFGYMPSREEVAISMKPAGKLRANMRAQGIPQEVQNWIEQYGTAVGKMQELAKEAGRAPLTSAEIADEFSVVGGKTDIGKKALGSTVFDAERNKSRAQARVEQYIADGMLPTLRKATNAFASFLNGLGGILSGPIGNVVGVIAGLGAGLAGVTAALGTFGGGILQTAAMMGLLTRPLGGLGRLLGGAGSAIAGGVRALGGAAGAAGGARGLLRTGARFLGRGLLVGGAMLVGSKVGEAIGGGYQGAAVTGAAGGAVLGTMIAPGVGTAIGAAAGAAAGAGWHGLKQLFGGEKGAGQDSLDYGSREEVDVLSSSAISTVQSALRGGQPGGVDDGDGATDSVGTSAGSSGGTRRGAAALAWMLRQSKSPSKSWYNLCLQDVRMSLGVGAKYGSASIAFQHTKKRHSGTPPPGVPVWWTGGYGHVALSAGGGMVWSNDILRRGKIDKVSIDFINKKWGKPYQGWTEDINDVDVYDPVGGSIGAQRAAGSRGGKQTVHGDTNIATDVPVPQGSMSGPQIFKLARDVGFDRGDATLMTAIAGAESTWRPGAHNPNRATGDNSYGLWQINMIDKLGPERRRWFGLKTNEELFNPRVNARAAWMLSNRGSKFTDWSTYNRGEHKAWMARAVAAAKSLPSYKDGAFHVSHDQLAVIHKDEMVLPPGPARKVREQARRADQQLGTDNIARGSVVVNLSMPIYVTESATAADAKRMVDVVVRELEMNERLAAVGRGD